VIIDTSMPNHAARHRKMLEATEPGPIRYVILTHGHGDHTGGVRLWMQPGTKLIAQKKFVDFRDYQNRLAGFYAGRNASQFGLPQLGVARAASQTAAIEPDILVDEKFDLALGGVRFEMHHTPGETYDHLTVWIPEWKVAFPGDNIYGSFPNIYTLRGTQPRWALDYVVSLEKVASWKPENLLPSHGRPERGVEHIQRAILKYVGAIRHVHDATVRGMNEGKDVFTLMKEVRLPKEFEIGEGYGNLPWSVRGIYEG